MSGELEQRLVPAVERATAILDLVAEGAEPPTVTQIAHSLKLPKSSVHGLCWTLSRLGLLREVRGRFQLGTHALKWAQAFLNDSDLVSEFQVALRKEPDIAGHTVSLSMLEGDQVIYLACQNGSAPLGVTFRIGMRLPAAFTATGKAMLALLPADAPVLSARLPEALTQFSVRDEDMLRSELDEVRRRGFSIDRGQVRVGMTCIGAAVRGELGQPVAGVALSLMDAEATSEAVGKLGLKVEAIARKLERFTAPNGQENGEHAS